MWWRIYLKVRTFISSTKARVYKMVGVEAAPVCPLDNAHREAGPQVNRRLAGKSYSGREGARTEAKTNHEKERERDGPDKATTHKHERAVRSSVCTGVRFGAAFWSRETSCRARRKNALLLSGSPSGCNLPSWDCSLPYLHLAELPLDVRQLLHSHTTEATKAHPVQPLSHIFHGTTGMHPYWRRLLVDWVV